MRNSGFTLMELLIALTLVSVLMAGVVTSNMNLIYAVRTADDARSSSQNIYTSFDLVEKDILAADGNFTAILSTDETEFNLSFQRSSDKTGPFVKNGSRIVVKYIRTGNAEDGYKLYREAYDPKFSTESERILITKQSSINLRFLDNKKVYFDEWRSKEPPLQIHLEFIDEKNKRWIRKFPVLVQEASL